MLMLDAPFRTAGKELGKKREGHTWWVFVASKVPGEERVAQPLDQSSPPGKEDQERLREKGTGERNGDEEG